jgi:diadenosine tetraphosphate (Ap4A) HIT family hydrolase
MLPEPWRIVLDSSHFVVLMGLGPISVGYCILITKKHEPCYAALPAEHIEEFLRVASAVQASQRQVFGNSIFFEHGRNGGCLPPAYDDDLCHHAHLHLLPADIDLAAAVRDDFTVEALGSWQDLMDTTQSGSVPYLLIQDGDKLACVRDPQKLPGRYLRAKTAEKILGDPVYADWQALPAYDIVRAGQAALRDTLRREWQLLAVEATDRANG